MRWYSGSQAALSPALRGMLSSAPLRLLRAVSYDMPSEPSEIQLAENVQHVCYEVAAMERAAELVPEGGRFRFEAFWLHARLLREFLWERTDSGGRGAHNSLLAEHYVDDVPEWRGTRGGLPDTLKRTKDRVDRQIVHLARDRHGDFVDLEAEVPSAQDELMKQWTRFEKARAQRWQDQFASSLDEKRSLLATNRF